MRTKNAKEYITELIDHGLTDDQVMNTLTTSTTMARIGRMVRPVDLIGIIRDLINELRTLHG